jgi:hypothetical protein
MTADARRFFLVERYLPATAKASVEAAVHRLGEALDATGDTRHIGTVHLPAEETCLSVFEAADEPAVALVNERAGFRLDRIVEAEWYGGPPAGTDAARTAEPAH